MENSTFGRADAMPILLSVLLGMFACFISAAPVHAAPQGDREHATFAPCTTSPRITCIVDGDTIWYHGTKIRIADINTPETTRPGCAYEAQMGLAATMRMMELLNHGGFTLLADGRDEDRYGRKLRVISRDGQSLGMQLVEEGLAEEWQGRRSDWCQSQTPGLLYE